MNGRHHELPGILFCHRADDLQTGVGRIGSLRSAVDLGEALSTQLGDQFGGCHHAIAEYGIEGDPAGFVLGQLDGDLPGTLSNQPVQVSFCGTLPSQSGQSRNPNSKP